MQEQVTPLGEQVREALAKLDGVSFVERSRWYDVVIGKKVVGWVWKQSRTIRVDLATKPLSCITVKEPKDVTKAVSKLKALKPRRK